MEVVERTTEATLSAIHESLVQLGVTLGRMAARQDQMLADLKKTTAALAPTATTSPTFLPSGVLEQPAVKPALPSLFSTVPVVGVGAPHVEAILAPSMPIRCSTLGLDANSGSDEELAGCVVTHSGSSFLFPEQAMGAKQELEGNVHTPLDRAVCLVEVKMLRPLSRERKQHGINSPSLILPWDRGKQDVVIQDLCWQLSHAEKGTTPTLSWDPGISHSHLANSLHMLVSAAMRSCPCQLDLNCDSLHTAEYLARLELLWDPGGSWFACLVPNSKLFARYTTGYSMHNLLMDSIVWLGGHGLVAELGRVWEIIDSGAAYWSGAVLVHLYLLLGCRCSIAVLRKFTNQHMVQVRIVPDGCSLGDVVVMSILCISLVHHVCTWVICAHVHTSWHVAEFGKVIQHRYLMRDEDWERAPCHVPVVVFCPRDISWYVKVLPASTDSVTAATMCGYQRTPKNVAMQQLFCSHHWTKGYTEEFLVACSQFDICCAGSTKLEMHTTLYMDTRQTWDQMVSSTVYHCWPLGSSSNEENNMSWHLQVQEEPCKCRNLCSFFGVSNYLEYKQWDPGIGRKDLECFLQQYQQILADRFQGCSEYICAAFRPCQPHQAIAWGQAMFLGGSNVVTTHIDVLGLVALGLGPALLEGDGRIRVYRPEELHRQRGSNRNELDPSGSRLPLSFYCSPLDLLLPQVWLLPQAPLYPLCIDLTSRSSPVARGCDTLVTFDHMDIALSKVFKPVVVNSILCLPQHQQMVLCALANTFQHCKKKATTLGELNKSYLEICRSSQVPAVRMIEFSNMCMILSDKGYLKLGQSKDDKLRRVTLQIDISDITFAFKGSRFFQKCLDQPKL